MATMMAKIRFYLFCIRWLWKNREWCNTMQKFKAMDKDYFDYLTNRVIRQVRKRHTKGGAE